jgi:hypothetical protein
MKKKLGEKAIGYLFFVLLCFPSDELQSEKQLAAIDKGKNLTQKLPKFGKKFGRVSPLT